MPGMYAVTSMPEVRRTRATLRSAELGFFGVWVNTRVHTPRRWGEPFSAGVFDFSGLVSRPLRTSCWMVGTVLLEPTSRVARQDLRFRVLLRRLHTGGAPGRRNRLAERYGPHTRQGPHLRQDSAASP